MQWRERAVATLHLYSCYSKILKSIHAMARSFVRDRSWRAAHLEFPIVTLCEGPYFSEICKYI